jgi:Leucine-rich repeat (LRR) protein
LITYPLQNEDDRHVDARFDPCSFCCDSRARKVREAASLSHVLLRVYFISKAIAYPFFASQLAMADSYNVPNEEIAALQDLYDVTNGTSWYWNQPGSKWNFSDPNPCGDAWQGVNCTQVPDEGFVHVQTLKLPEFGLVGRLPASLVQLTQLTELELGHNGLSGTVPEYLGQFSRLVSFSLRYNDLTGTLPDSLGQLPQLTKLYLNGNQLVGTVPAAWGQLTQLRELALNYNQLHGTIPAFLGGSLLSLRVLSLYNNAFSGTVPSALQQLTQLVLLFMDHNQLTGTIPASLGQLSFLVAVALDNNRLSGTIPNSLGGLSLLAALGLNNNRLSGTIPSWSQLAHLADLALDINILTGTLPAALGQLRRLNTLEFGTNRLTGTILASLGQLPELRAVALDTNRLTGTLPQNWTVAARTLNLLHLNQNKLSGTIPASLADMPVLLSLNLSGNRLTGTIPTSLRQLSSLEVLMLHNNQLRGSVAELFNPSKQKNLSTVQLSGNHLTGTLPAAAFLLPSLNSFAAVDNCFEGPLPEEAICHNVKLDALILDGLHSAPSCVRSASLSRKAFKLGTVPPCLLTLPRLATLHLSGNGLTGSLPTGVNISTVLTDLSLSHNLLTGEIPANLLHREWNKLDLSFNRLTGTLHSASAAPYSNTTDLRLQHNRLSGVLPGSVQRVGSLSLLEVNMFSCRVDRSDVPHQDTSSGKYTCGSDAVNNSLYGWLAVLSVAVAAVVVSLYRGQRIAQVRTYLSSPRDNSLPRLQSVCNTAQILAYVGTGSAAYCVTVLLAVYVAVNWYHTSFTYKYAWTASGVFLSGAVAFALEAAFLLMQLLVCAYVTDWLLSRPELPSPPTAGACDTASTGALNVTVRQAVISGAALVAGLLFVVGINVAFVIATLRLNGRQLLIVQILLAAFKLGYNNFIAPMLQKRVNAPSAGQGAATTRLLLILVNVIVIPCVVVMFISPACFYDAIKGSESVTSTYSYDGFCMSAVATTDPATGAATLVCGDVQVTSGITTYVPSFTYSYQCSGSFVTFYAPTFVIMSIITAFVLPARRLVLLWLRHNLSPASRFYPLSISVTPRILRELLSPQDLVRARSKPLYRPVFDANKLMMSLLTYLALLLTFGALFPPLAVCCTVAMASVVLTARLEVGRYVSVAVAAGRQDCLDEVESACTAVATPQQLHTTLCVVLMVSCMFYTLFLFDTLGDEVGFTGAFWVLIVVPLLPLAAVAFYAALSGLQGTRSAETRKVGHTVDPEAGVALADIVQAPAGDEAGETENAGHTDSFGTNPMHTP